MESIYQYVMKKIGGQSVRALQPLAKELGISARTLHNIAVGVTVDPGVHKIEKIAQHFKAKEKPRK